MSMGGGDTTTVQKSDPWKGLQPYLTSLYKSTGKLSGVEMPYYPGQTLAGYTDPQLAGQEGMLNYATYGLPTMTGAATGAWYGSLSPDRTTLQMLGDQLGPEAYSTISNIMGGAGISQPIYAPSVGVTPYTPMVGGNNPYLPYNTYSKMMSGQVDLGPYNDIAEAATGRMTDAFNTQVLPNIRDEGILTGAYGGSRQDIATQNQVDLLHQNIGDMLANLYGGAYNTAMNQRATGAQLATTAGLGVGEMANARNIEQARLGMQAQELAGQIGSKNADIVMQAQTLAQAGRQEDAAAMLEAAGLSRDLITQAGNLSVDQQSEITKALALSPVLGSFGMSPYQAMMDVGGQQQAMDQAQIDAMMKAYFYNQQEPWTRLSNYAGILSGVPVAGYGTTSSTTPTDPYAAAMSTGMMTGGLYSMGMMNPYWAIGLPLLSYAMNS